MSERFDIAIIGTGPAGLEAAITASVRGKKVLLLGEADLSSKLSKAHEINNYLGFPHISGADLANRFSEHLKSLNLSITPDRIAAVYPMGDYYALQGKQENYETTCIILATGMIAEKPLPGELENLGRGVSYCATCDAAFYRGKTAIIAAYTPSEEDEAIFLAEVADKVTYLPVYESRESLSRLKSNEKIEVIENEKPISLSRADNKTTVTCASGASVTADGAFILRDSIAPGTLLGGLETDGPHINCDRTMSTNLPGVFACGDVTGLPYQYIKAAGEGNVAALSAVRYLASSASKSK